MNNNNNNSINNHYERAEKGKRMHAVITEMAIMNLFKLNGVQNILQPGEFSRYDSAKAINFP